MLLTAHTHTLLSQQSDVGVADILDILDFIPNDLVRIDSVWSELLDASLSILGSCLVLQNAHPVHYRHLSIQFFHAASAL